MGNNSSKATSEEVFQVRDELQEQLEKTKRELKNLVEETKKELTKQLVAATGSELQQHLMVAMGEMRRQSREMIEGLKEVRECILLKNKDLERKNTELANEKGRLEKQLEYARKAALVFMDAADTYQEAAEKRIKAKVEELKDTRKVALVFMDAADMYQEAAERQIKARVEELEDTRNAALVFMDATDTYQEAAEKKIKARVEELEDMRKADLVFMDDGGTYKEEEEKQIRERVEILEDKRMVFMGAANTHHEAEEKQIKATIHPLEVLGQEAKMDVWVESLESRLRETLASNWEMEADVTAKKREYDLVHGENDMLQLDVLTTEPKPNISKVAVETKRLKMELGALPEVKRAAANVLDADKEEIMKEPEDLKRKLEEIQTIKDIVMYENEMFWSEDFIAEQRYGICEVEVERPKMILDVLTEATETATNSFDSKEAKIMKELEKIHASKVTDADKQSVQSNLLHVSMLQLQASGDELDAKYSRMNGKNNLVLKAQDAEPKPKCEALEDYNTEKDGEIAKLRVVSFDEKKKEGIDHALGKDIEGH